MANLFKVKVQELQPKEVILEITSIHPDSGNVPESIGFGLMLLYDASNDENEIRKSVDLELLLDETWMSNYAKGYIKSIQLISQNGLDGVVRVQVTHPSWLRHLVSINEWETTAFSITSDYEECDPIFPDDKTTIDTTPIHTIEKEGFYPTWKYFMSDNLLSSNKVILWTKMYPDSFYKEDETKEPIQVSESNLKLYEGEFVKIGDDMGILYRGNTSWMLGSIDATSAGYRSINGETIIPLVLNKRKKRLPYPLHVSRFLRSFSSCVVLDANILNDTIELRVIQFHPDNEISIPTSAHALQLLLRPFKDEHRNQRFIKGFPLSNFINSKMDENNINRIDYSLYLDRTENGSIPNDLVKSIILDYELFENINNLNFPNLENLTNSELIELYDFNKWPQSIIKIKVSDAMLLTNYSDRLPIPFVFNYL